MYLKKFDKIFLSVIIFFGLASLSKVALGVDSFCENLAIGPLQLVEDAEISTDARFILKYDKGDMLRNGGLDLAITHIASSRTAYFKTTLQTVFVGASPDLEKILLQSAVGDRSEFFVYKINGQKILQFKIPFMNQVDEDVNEVLYDETNRQWLIVTNNRIVVFLEQQKILKTLLELKESRTNSFEWLGSFGRSKFVTLANNGNSILTLTAQNSDGQNISILRVFNAKTLQVDKILNIPAPSSGTLFDDTHLLFDDKDGESFHLVDVVTGDLKKKLFLEATDDAVFAKPRTIKELFEGPDQTIGLIDDSGEIWYYSNNGQVVYHEKIPSYMRWSKIRVISGSSRLFLLDQDQVSIFTFDTKNHEFIRMPQVMNSLVFSGYFLSNKDQVFLPIYNKQANKLSVLGFQIKGQCAGNLPSVSNAEEMYHLLMNRRMTGLSWLDMQTDSSLSFLSQKIGNDINIAEMEKWKGAVFNFLESYLTMEHSSSFKNTFNRTAKWLTIFQPVLSRFNDGEKERLMDSLAVSLAEKINRSSEFAEYPISKVANLYVANLKPYFGMATEPRTDFILLKTSKSNISDQVILPTALSSAPFEGEGNIRVDGFYIKNNFPAISVNRNEPKSFNLNWQIGPQKWNATGSVELLSLKYLINRESSPRYGDFWADDKLTGLILISPNLGNPTWLVRQYLSYFKDQGFDFGPAKIVWPNGEKQLLRFLNNVYLFPTQVQTEAHLKDWMKNLIQTGQLDYWVKEAHGGGNEEVVFLGKRNSIIEGRRLLENGKEEIIYIAYSDSETFSSEDFVPVSNEEFGMWLRDRENLNSHGQLVYFNASCWSASKARQEIISARTPLLVEIATGIPALTFKNSQDNHAQVLLTSFRNGLDYSQLGANLEAVKTLDGTKNPFILPPQQEYDKKIWNGLGSALSYSFKLSN